MCKGKRLYNKTCTLSINLHFQIYIIYQDKLFDINVEKINQLSIDFLVLIQFSKLQHKTWKIYVKYTKKEFT